MVVLASEPVCVCGVDVAAPQQVANRQTVIDLCNRDVGVFTDAELVLLHAQTPDEKEQLFRRLWSCKEAFVKARGDGLACELNRAEFTEIEAISSTAFGAKVLFDGKPQPLWNFRIERLGGALGNHYITVARAPPLAIVDALGEFRATLEQQEFPAPAWRDALQAAWPAFEELRVEQLDPGRPGAAAAVAT